MESLEKRYKIIAQCLDTLYESIDFYQSRRFEEVHKQLRDSVIQRFEFSFDTFWKFLKEYIELKHEFMFPTISPGAVLKKAFMAGLIESDEYEIFDGMMRDRNITSHTYNETLAEEIAERILSYYRLLTVTIERIKNRSNDKG